LLKFLTYELPRHVTVQILVDILSKTSRANSFQKLQNSISNRGLPEISQHQ